MTTDNTTVSAPVQTNNKPVKPDFGAGRYTPLMEEVYNTSQAVFRINAAKAEALARKCASDMGAIMASAPVEIKFGKLSKDGKLTIREAAKLKGVTCTDTITVLRALQYAGDAGTYGFSFSFTQWETSSDHPLHKIIKSL